MYKRLEKSKYVENYNFPKVLFDSNKRKSEGMMSMAMSSFNQDIPIPASIKLNKDFKLANQMYGKFLIRIGEINKGQYYNYKYSGVIRFSQKEIKIIS